MRRFLLAPDEMIPFPREMEVCALGVVVIAAYLSFTSFLVVFLGGMPGDAIVHLQLDALATPLLVIAVLVWLPLRFLGVVGAHSGTGFGVAGLAVAARAHVALVAYLGTAPEYRYVLSADLMALSRHTATVAYVFGLACVLAESWRSWRGGRRTRQAGRDGARPARVSAPVRVTLVLLFFGCAVTGLVLVLVAWWQLPS